MAGRSTLKTPITNVPRRNLTPSNSEAADARSAPQMSRDDEIRAHDRRENIAAGIRRRK
jgi:hypothetical protein